jgi:hypothetical protein
VDSRHKAENRLTISIHLVVTVFARRYGGLAVMPPAPVGFTEAWRDHQPESNFEGKSMKIYSKIANFPATTEASL